MPERSTPAALRLGVVGAGATVTRTASLILDSDLPANVDRLDVRFAVADDGASGADARPADNEAVVSVAVATAINVPANAPWALAALALLVAAAALRRIGAP